MTMSLIETKTLGTTAASIEFTSIPQNFTDLVVLSSCRTDRAGQAQDRLKATFNGIGTDYDERRLFGNGTITGIASDSRFFVGFATGPDATANTFSSSSCHIPNYTAAIHKSGSLDSVTENNDTAGFQFISTSLWSNTAAITSILIESDTASTLQIGSTVSLYGIKSGSDGIVTTS